MTDSQARSLGAIAREINRKWNEPFYGARPYIAAMRRLTRITDWDGAERADDIVRGFLTNAGTWHGETARRIKAELREMLKGTRS